MKWKAFIFWTFVFIGLLSFFYSFNIYLYKRQEELQFFIPQWPYIKSILWIPGGCCTALGQFFVQYYQNSLFASLLNSTLLCGIGIFFYLILQQIVQRTYNYLLALIPVLGLLKMHLRLNYVLDGTLGLFLMMALLFGFTLIQGKRRWLIYSVLSTLVVYSLAGQLVILYTALLFIVGCIHRFKGWQYTLLPMALGSILTYIGARFSLYIPLIEGLQPAEYHEMQLQPDSYIYYVWIRFVFVAAILLLSGYLLKHISWSKWWRKSLITVVIAIVLFDISGMCLPDPYDVQNRMADRISSLAQQKEWDAIIRMHQGKRITNYVSLNFLNMALAQKGLLGDKLFYFDQKGPKSLLADWNHTFFMSKLLSDIHFMIGDLSMSEAYAMDGLTLAKRKGSPRMMQRLVQINLIKGDKNIAEKYINLLSQMPCYKEWAEKYRGYLGHPDLMKLDNLLASKKAADPAVNDLLCLVETDSLWMMHIEETGVNKTALEYLGCSYLLAKELDKFKSLLVKIEDDSRWQKLPVHFQEAALILSIKDPTLLKSISIEPSISERFKEFQIHNKMEHPDNNQIASLYQLYGNTFWFYYYYKQLK